MPAEKNWAEEYGRVRPLYLQFSKKLKTLVKELLEKDLIEYHLIEARAKSLDSFVKKTEGQPHSPRCANPLKEITDLSGIRVVVYYTDDVDRVSNVIEREFIIDRANSVDKGALLKPQEFGYRSVHYVVSLSKSRQELSEWCNFKNLKAEIQIRSVLQHAWAAIDHKLRYKREADVPFPISRKLFRLSGLLELADEEFLGIRAELKAIETEFRKRIAAKDTNLGINAMTLAEYLKSSEKVSALVNSASQSGFELMGDTSESLSQLVAFCTKAGISNVGQLEEFVDGVAGSALKYFIGVQRSIPHAWIVSAGYILMYLLVAKNEVIFSDAYMMEQGWSSDIIHILRQHSNILSSKK